MKRKGFTLIELVVVIALIAILAVTLAPRLRDQIAKANDAKAIAVLGSLRTGSEIYFAENTKTMRGATSPAFSSDALAVTELRDNYMDQSAKELFDSQVYVPIGGSKTTSGSGGTVEYGGNVGFVFTNPDTTASSDGISMWLSTAAANNGGTAIKTYDTKGNEWASY